MAAVELTREAATALLVEARREFENAAHELVQSDRSQRPAIDACIEIIGRLNWKVDRWWPQETSEIGGKYDKHSVTFGFTGETLEWIERQRDGQAGYVEDLERGVNVLEPGDLSEAVYLLHVLRGIVAQREAVAV